MADKYKFTNELFKEKCTKLTHNVKRWGGSRVEKEMSEENAIKFIEYYAGFLNKIFYDVGKIHYGYDLTPDGYGYVDKITKGKYKTIGEILERIMNGGFKVSGSYSDNSNSEYDSYFSGFFDDKNSSIYFESTIKAGYVHLFFPNGDVDYEFDDFDGNRFSLKIYFNDKEFKVEYEDMHGSFYMDEFKELKYQKRYVKAMYDEFGDEYIKNLKGIFDDKKAELDKEKAELDNKKTKLDEELEQIL